MTASSQMRKSQSQRQIYTFPFSWYCPQFVRMPNLCCPEGILIVRVHSWCNPRCFRAARLRLAYSEVFRALPE